MWLLGLLTLPSMERGVMSESGAGERVFPGDWTLEPPLRARCQAGEVPAVVLGDLTLVRPLGWRGIPVVAVSTTNDDVVFRSRYVDGRCVVPGFLPPDEAATVSTLRALGAELQSLCGGRRIPLIYGSDAQLEMLYRHRAGWSGGFCSC